MTGAPKNDLQVAPLMRTGLDPDTLADAVRTYKSDCVVCLRKVFNVAWVERLPNLDAMRDELDIVRFDLEPGDCTVYHGLKLHGAPGNAHAERRRRAYVTRWGGDGVTYDPRDGTQPMLHDPGINSGDELDCELWPVVWQRGV